MGLAIAACEAILCLGSASAYAESPHHLATDSEQLATNQPTYQLKVLCSDPQAPPGEEAPLVEFVNPIPYSVQATADPGVWRHYIIYKHFPGNGQPVPGFTCIRQVCVFGEWLDECDVTATWIP